MDPIQNLSNDFTAWVAPLFAISLALVIGMALRDWATNLVLGMKFKFDEAWYEGAHCFIDDEPAIIVKIGIGETIFQISNGRGTVWRHVSNERIKYLKIERVIDRPRAAHAKHSDHSNGGS
jgi:hypothetical protein